MKYSIEIYTESDQLNLLKKTWYELSENNQAPKWVEADLEYLIYLKQADLLEGEPYVVVLKDQNDKALLFSIGEISTAFISPSIKYLKLSFLKFRKTRYHIFPFSFFVNTDSAEVIQEFFRLVTPKLKSHAVDYIYFNLIPRESILTNYLLSISNPLKKDIIPSIENHYLLERPASLEAYLDTKDSRSRYNYKQIIKKLENEFKDKIVIKVFTDESEIDIFFEHAEQIAKNSQLRALNVGFKHSEYELKKKKWLAAKGYFRSYILYLDDIPCSFILGINYNGLFLAENIGFDNNYNKQRVGSYLRLKVLEDFANTKFADIMEYGHGPDEYKKAFSSIMIEDLRYKLYLPKFSNVFFIVNQSVFTIINKWLVFFLKKIGIHGFLRRKVRDIFIKRRKI